MRMTELNNNLPILKTCHSQDRYIDIKNTILAHATLVYNICYWYLCLPFIFSKPYISFAEASRTPLSWVLEFYVLM